jgi:hypothetical protein
MANRYHQPLRGLGRDHSRCSGMRDTVSHYIPLPNPLTSTAPQAFSNNLTMPSRGAQDPATPAQCQALNAFAIIFNGWMNPDRKLTDAKVRSAVNRTAPEGCVGLLCQRK